MCRWGIIVALTVSNQDTLELALTIEVERVAINSLSPIAIYIMLMTDENESVRIVELNEGYRNAHHASVISGNIDYKIYVDRIVIIISRIEARIIGLGCNMLSTMWFTEIGIPDGAVDVLDSAIWLNVSCRMVMADPDLVILEVQEQPFG